MEDEFKMESIAPILELEDRGDAYFRLVRLFLDGKKSCRNEVRSSWDFGVEWEYPNPHRLTCSIGEPLSCETRIEASLAYYAIAGDNSTGDFREVICGMAMKYHACLISGIDAEKMFSRIASFAVGSVKAEMERFPKRPDDKKSMDAFNISMIINNDREFELDLKW